MLVLDNQVSLYLLHSEEYISLTDIAKFENPQAPADIIKNWLRSKSLACGNASTIPILNWSNSTSLKMKLGTITLFFHLKNGLKLPMLLGCLSNMKNLNAVFIDEGLSQGERLQKLNTIAISQMTILSLDQRTNKLQD